MTRTLGIADGVFAPGHIGELTRIIPFEMVDEVLAQTGAVQRRVRLIPARVTVCLLLAAALFNGLGCQQVFDRLCAGLSSLAPVRPSGSALRQARQRLGPAPMKALFNLVSGPAATTAAAGRWRGLRVVAVDGTLLVRLYHERWEIETAYAELKSTIMGGRVLRARTPDGIEQEVWALLTTYQALRTAMTDATDIDLVGTIGRHVLAHLLPTRRVRTKDRTSNERSPNTTHADPPSTGPPTKPPSASACSRAALDAPGPALTERRWY
ncbi:transposase [Streptomyces sp. NPDC059153]|uniref:transposase n=1 Tax=Streptomyces sp. NPDC059153 TaxID=3346743 RepID=UPI0036930074